MRTTKILRINCTVSRSTQEKIVPRRTESARTLLVNLIKQLEASSKKMMFRFIQQVKKSQQVKQRRRKHPAGKNLVTFFASLAPKASGLGSLKSKIATLSLIDDC